MDQALAFVKEVSRGHNQGVTTLPALTRRRLDLAGLDVPALDITGTGDGPQLTVLAGVHGCEYAPMAAQRIWARSLAGRELRGRVLAIPVLNLPAFWARSPFVVPDDGKNLNRCFPGNPAGQPWPTKRLAHDTFTKVIEGSDALIDMHAGDMVEALEPFALYEAGAAEARAREHGRRPTASGTSSAGNPARTAPWPARPGTAAAQIGVAAITAEAGGCGLVEQAAVDAHRARPEPGAGAGWACPVTRPGHQTITGCRPARCGRFLWLRCLHAGFWAPAEPVGSEVAEDRSSARSTASTVPRSWRPSRRRPMGC